MSVAALGRSVVLGGAAWTIGTYVAVVAVRFGSNIVLSRLIAPEVFGMVAIVSAVRAGADLLSDVGIGQSVVTHPDGEKAAFRDTAWTVQLIRGLLLFAACLMLAGPVADLYGVPEAVIQLGAVTVALLGATSTSIYLLQRRLQLARLNLFDLAQDVISSVSVLCLAALSPTIWAILAANILAATVRVAMSFLLPEARNRPALQRDHARAILRFGKWIFAWSFLGFLCLNVDRLYLGQAVPLAVLGVYGIARTMADLPAMLAGRLGHSLIFPLVSASASLPRGSLRREIAPLRLHFLLAAALCLAGAIALGDCAIRAIYDPRYAEAGWMLPLLLAGTWGTVLCATNEYVLIGLGRPQYSAAGNCLKLAYLILALPAGFGAAGLTGAILVLASAEAVRYAALLAGPIRERIAFRGQDLLATLMLVGLVAVFTLLRHEAGFGTAFDGIPLPGGPPP
ncbi:oligosaccharide flippase family protein [Methylorubrum salsuginis]|uniref:Membrane protein involved in the export of O-antigen and teichoic acid n=1 Tax=Methylorubrum salsuginis TaxID=414703 RepID=A0A1I4LS20_9HYPH|nr:oligosaccharide flippase family protein [Methylorubrum salsuginis]SFL93613.1 Membrane protein involved in the export of O-antigen and teichoic acid [Methylorubrum salsuginis]